MYIAIHELLQFQIPYKSKCSFNSQSPPTQTASDKAPQSSTNNVQVPDIDFLDDSFDFEIASLQNPEIENLLTTLEMKP